MEQKTIMIMEDEESSLQALKVAFEEKKHRVLTATNGQEGLETVKKEKPDLVLLDVIMPKMDGFEVMEAMRNMEETKNIPVILLTNLSQPQDIERAIEMGAKTYLVKSEYQLKDIVAKVEAHLK